MRSRVRNVEPSVVPKQCIGYRASGFDFLESGGRKNRGCKQGKGERLSLGEFVQMTTSHTLDPWQWNLCSRLERLREERGQRLLIHAPPQAGKSIILSQRFPSWLIGLMPEIRIKVACYNIAQATRFSKIGRDIMQGEQYEALFPQVNRRLEKTPSQEEWSTQARLKRRDGQPSLKALGLQTGFVGQGADLLIVDDPYASASEVMSPIIRDSVWMFWEESAKVRLAQDANVVVMFHRYHMDDLAGRLMREEGLKAEGGDWELLRYATVADGEGDDPLGRPIGERLSPRMTDKWLEDMQRRSSIWLGQFQGRPIERNGAFFFVNRLQVVESAPEGLPLCRAWDQASTEGGGDYTAGIKMAGPDTEGYFYITDVVRGQWSTDRRDRVIREAAINDGAECRIRGVQDPGAAGVDARLAFLRNLAGWRVDIVRASGAKEVRADPMSSYVNAGMVRLVRGSWNRDFVEELRAFPKGRHDDQVDAAADAFNMLTQFRKGRCA